MILIYLDTKCQNLIFLHEIQLRSSFFMRNQLNFFMTIFMNKKRNRLEKRKSLLTEIK